MTSVPNELIKHIIEKQSKKGAHKAIEDLMKAEQEKNKIYFDGLKSYSIRKK